MRTVAQGPSTIASQGTLFTSLEREQRGTPPDDLDAPVAVYDSGIRYADDSLRRLMALLDTHELRESSVIVITSDHGEECFEHGRTQHKQLHCSPNLHVPLLFLIPNHPPRVVEETVELLSVLPTVLDLLGLPRSIARWERTWSR